MYDLVYQGKEKNWKVIIKDGGSFRGTLSEVTSYCIHYLMFDIKELDRGIDEMIKNNHDIVHFGFKKSLLCTFDSAKHKIEENGVMHGFH
jgi:hypothetical protein